jgi:hypothetical protein
MEHREIRGRGHFTRLAAGGALLIAIGIVVAAVVIAGNSSSPRASDVLGRVTGATTVQRRNLVQTDTQAGTLSYAKPQTVYNRLSGTITWLPSIGAAIRTGQPLFRVNGQPVVLLDGSTPAYRALGPSDSAGLDILELNRSLVELGYSGYGIVVDDTWQAATTSAVDALQQSLGETATGTLALGKAVFLPGTQLVSTVTGTLGATQASTTVAPAAPQFVSLEHPLASTGPSGPTGATYPVAATGTGSTGAGGSKTHTPGKGTTGSPTSAQTLSALEALLRAEAAQLRAQHSNPSSGNPSGSSPGSKSNSPSSSPSSPSSKGNGGNGGNGSGGGGAATAIMQTSSTKLVVTVDLSASVQSEAVVGEKVQVQMPAGNTVNGLITAVSPVAQSSSNNNNNSGSGNGGNGNGNGNGSGSTIPVTVTLNGHHTGAGLDQASVSVNFAQARAKNVLSVPVTALLAIPGGNYAVQTAAAPHKLIPVTVGLFAAGYVQISGAGIYPGLAVTDSQG